MAKKSTGRLAGLAALAATAYMLNKGKGESKADAKADTKDTAAENNRIADARAAREEDKGAALFMSGEDERPAPTGMGAATKLVTPAKVARSEKAPSASVAPTSSQTQRFAPSGSPVLSSGAGSGGPRIVGLGRSSGRGGPEAGEEAAYKSAKEAQALKDFSAKRPGIVARMREKDKEMAASRRNADDGGKSMVDRQNAGAKRAGLSVDDYYTSGKKTIDEQDGTFKRGGKVKKMASGGMTSSSSSRGDGIASKGKTRCKMY
jgi:hypothetical protein